MDVPSLDEYKELINKRNEPSISIYIPTHRKGEDAEQDPIRFKNHLREIEKELLKKEHRQQEIESLIKPAKSLIDDVNFWNQQSDGLAIFISPGEFFYYRIPIYFTEQHFISDRYYLRPLVPVLNGNDRFLILALNQKNVRLFESTKYNIHELDLQDVPTSIEEYMQYVEEDRSLQFHTQTGRQTFSGKQGAAGTRSAMFHEHGGGTDSAVKKENIKQFFHLVDQGLMKKLNSENTPMLLAGIEYLLPIYKETNSYPHTLENILPVNTQSLSDDELRQAAYEIVNEGSEKLLQDALNQYGNLANKDRATDQIDDIIKNVFSNRVLYLFTNSNLQAWGKVDIDKYDVELHDKYEPGDIDLIDLATGQTLLHNGIVFSVKPERMPNGSALAALYRY